MKHAFSYNLYVVVHFVIDACQKALCTLRYYNAVYRSLLGITSPMTADESYKLTHVLCSRSFCTIGH